MTDLPANVSLDGFSDLRGASVFITGGGSGIGAALTGGFCAQGARVAFVGRSDASAVVAEIAQKTGNAPLFIRCDITDTAALQAAIQQAAAAHGPVRVLVNNAGNDTRMVTDEVTPQMWDDSLSVNLDAYFFAAQEAARMMRAAGGGAIVNFTSITALFGMPGAAPYVTANGGIIAMTRALAREWGKDGIRVNAIAPGWVFTQRQLDLWATPEGVADFLKRQCLPEKISTVDLIGPTLFLASGASSVITGQVLPVDAGVANAG